MASRPQTARVPQILRSLIAKGGVAERSSLDKTPGISQSMAAKKKPPVMTECEVKVRGRWLPCTIYEALTERNEIMRCRYCHGPVQALKESSTGARAHIEHLQSHSGCRFPQSRFCGVESRHPLALK